ncbi:MAG TPA: metalloregulator ArsR/SmtB family transcription factor [Dehalococcoidia bacterium]|nr:metalloregulator ArsR/SmtB family transcription factor [Dehalococcoidia bacterium]
MRDFVKLFKALSNEIRIRILKVLLERECCVCEVMQALNISKSRVSRNLGTLEDAGFIKSNRDGPWIVYSVDRKELNNYGTSLIELLRGSLVDEEIILQDKQRLSRAVRVGPRAIKKYLFATDMRLYA